MTTKFIKIRLNETTREEFQKKAKAEGVTMTQLIQGWIKDYLEEETGSTGTTSDDSELWQRLEALEQKIETPTTTVNQETEQKLQQYIQYVDQRIDTLENVVITPIKKDLDGVKNSWKALFNQIRELEGKVNQFRSELEKFHTQTKQSFARITQYINQKFQG
ncbi:hypothetical protein PCC7418_1811 [Halothece sp. PCC 7418]|uniref:hypothetical protein n=1 Tax=Halothece sp. (strain PCC 7418) TaxID=65093 RepID=UPI0002A08950|nr:hypothetical protein [Halothece sp. PCC 7418]AFZ43979.1 hypothetical protein PCC7418_1811 [Halothece sp. PCC 7418]